MVYCVGSIDTVAGRLVQQGSGLAVVGVPMVMGKDTSAITAALEQKLVKLRPALWRTRPSYVLTVRVVLAFAISGAEYVYDVVPVGQKALQKLQSLVDTILRDAIRLP